MLTKSPLLCWHTRPLFVGTCDVAMPRLLCAVDPEGRSLLTRTYGNVATPSFPTVALLASVAAYAEATGTGSLRRVSCDDGFQIAFRRSAGGVRWVLATAGDTDETRVDAMLMMCERIAEGVCGRDALNCDAGERRGGAQRMKMALGACVAAIDRAMDTRAPPSFAPFGVHVMNRTKIETETERDDDDASARTFVEGLASALPTVDRVAMVATTSGSGIIGDDVEILASTDGWRSSMCGADGLVAHAVLASVPPGPDARDVPVYVDDGMTPARLLTVSVGKGREAAAIAVGPEPTLTVFRAAVKLTTSKLSYH